MHERMIKNTRVFFGFSSLATRTSERAGREPWIGQVRSRKELDVESTRRDVESKGKQKQQEPRPLAPVKKEEWPRFLRTGDKYIDACKLARATVRKYTDSA